MQHKFVLEINESKHRHLKGEWASATVIYVGEQYNHNTGLYECIVAHTSASGNEPGVGGTWETYWLLVCGPTTPLGEVIWKGTWSDATTYAAGDGVLRSGIGYVSIQNTNLNHQPPNATWWAALTPMDHGALTGLGDNDHTIYILHSLATAANDFLIASGAGVYVKKTLAEVKALLGLVDSTAWTPTGSWTSNVTYTGLWRRVGSRGYYEVKIALSGAPNSTGLCINLPADHVIDGSKLVDVGNLQSILGVGDALDAGVTRYFLLIKYNDANSILVAVLNSSATNASDNERVTQAVPHTFENGDVIIAKFDVPIVGWS